MRASPTRSSSTSARPAGTASRGDYPASLGAAWAAHLAPRTSDAPTVISTFAGGGGSSLGYSMAGYRELLAVEWDDNAVATFRLNFPEVPVYHGDIAALTIEDCLGRAGIGPGELDVLDGSPPCQGFSTAGKRQMDDPRNSLFKEYVRLLRGLRPKAFVMENVSGMVKGKMKLVFAEILSELKASGYRVRARLLNAMYFGVPQSRERMIFVGMREDLGIEPSHPKGESMPFGPCLDYAGEPLTLKESSSTREHRARHEARGNGFGYTTVSPARPTSTFRKARIAGGCPILVKQGATLLWPSRRELGWFASFPERYRFAGSYDDQWERIGNSVPPLFMRAIASHLRGRLEGTV